MTINRRRKTRGEFASESYTSCHVRPSRYIYYIYIYLPQWYINIYIYINTCIYGVLLFRNLLCFAALSRRNRYIILGLLPDLLLEQRPHPLSWPTRRRRLLFRKGFTKSSRDTCPTFLSAAAVEPADEIQLFRSPVVQLLSLWFQS